MIIKTSDEISKEIMADYPEIQSLHVEYIEKGRGYGIGLRDEDCNKRGFTEKTICERVRCSNDLCYNGGFSVLHILNFMVKKKETHWEGPEKCIGYEGSKKGKIKYQSCPNFFKLKVDIDYKK